MKKMIPLIAIAFIISALLPACNGRRELSVLGEVTAVNGGNITLALGTKSSPVENDGAMAELRLTGEEKMLTITNDNICTVSSVGTSPAALSDISKGNILEVYYRTGANNAEEVISVEINSTIVSRPQTDKAEKKDALKAAS